MSDGLDLVLLTAAYPYGNKSETFLEAEMEVLARRFRRVFVLPSRREPTIRPLPENIELVEMEWLDEPSTSRKARALATWRAASTVAATLAVPGNAGAYLSWARVYLDLLAKNVLRARALEAFVVRNGLEGAVFYDYWMENSTLALALLRKAGVVRAAACRAHGFDVYDHRWGDRPVPFREVKARHLDLVAPVSDFGRAYLLDRLGGHDGELAGRVRTFRLGVRAQASPSRQERAQSQPALVLTCGSLIPTKRVEMVPAVLARLDRPVRWVHLGDGPERADVEAAARTLPPRVSWELRGHVDNSQVLDFYRSQPVAALLSLSVSEGLPVSMMEALSFGVPVVAVGVQGVPEIVTSATGVLLDPEAGADEVARGLAEALEPGRFDPERMRALFLEHFEAERNYNEFADALIALL